MDTENMNSLILEELIKFYLVKQNRELLQRINKAIKYLKDREEDNGCCSVCNVMSDRLLEILEGGKNEKKN